MNKENQLREFIVDELLDIDANAQKLSEALNISLDKLQENEMQIRRVFVEKIAQQGSASKAEFFREAIYRCNPKSIMEVFMLGAIAYDTLQEME